MINKLTTSILKFILYPLIVKTPIILQSSETECGVISLAIIFSYYHIDFGLEKLREQCNASRDGCKAATLMQVATMYGLSAQAYKVDIDALYLLNEPVIAFWNFNHYVVINRVGKNKAFINDPAHGPRAISLGELDKSFTGVILILKPIQQVKKNLIKFPKYIHLKNSFSSFNKEIFYILLCLSIILAVPLFNSALSTLLINFCIIPRSYDWVRWITIFSIFFYISFSVASIQQKYNQFKIITKVSLLKSANVISHVLCLPMIFYSLRSKAEIISTLHRTESVVQNTFKSSTNILIHLMSIIIYCLFMLKLNMQMAISSLALILLFSICVLLTTKQILAKEKSNLNFEGKLYSYGMTAFRNIETIKACSLENNILQKWQMLFCNKLNVQNKIDYLNIFIKSLNHLFNVFAMVLLFMIGGMQISKGNLTIGGLLGFYSLHLLLYASVSSIIQAIKEFQSSYLSHGRINDLLIYKKAHNFQLSSCANLVSSIQSIVLNNLGFQFNQHSKLLLKNINLTITPGQHVAIVGGTGSGKSTLIKLICGHYHATEGELILFGNNILNYSAENIAKLLAYVSQDNALFTGSLYDNLTLWKNVPLDEVHNAIQTACLSDLINSRGLYSEVLDNGDNFSGGEKQRIDIARALIQNTPILVLDEATSALDNATQKMLISNLQKLDKTIIYVAHRLSSIQHANQIVVLEDGKVVEIGNHEKLIKQNGYYSQLLVGES